MHHLMEPTVRSIVSCDLCNQRSYQLPAFITKYCTERLICAYWFRAILEIGQDMNVNVPGNNLERTIKGASKANLIGFLMELGHFGVVLLKRCQGRVT